MNRFHIELLKMRQIGWSTDHVAMNGHFAIETSARILAASSPGLEKVVGVHGHFLITLSLILDEAYAVCYTNRLACRLTVRRDGAHFRNYLIAPTFGSGFDRFILANSSVRESFAARSFRRIFYAET